MMEEERPDYHLNCELHGSQQATFVCRHLVESLRTRQMVGYHCSQEDETNPRPDAWCSACERKRVEGGGDWNDESESFATVTLLCGACYDLVREMQQRSSSQPGFR